MTQDHVVNDWFQRLKQFLNLEPKNKEQLISLLRHAQIRSLINTETLAMLEGALLFAQMQVRDIMLPKKQMVCVRKEDALQDVIRIVTASGHSRFPVIGDHPDQVIGILHAKDLLRYQSTSSPSNFDLEDIVRTTTFVPESKHLDVLLSEFRTHRNHMAIVVDEYGAVAGFVTLEDLIEQIVGEIEDEFDIDEEAYIKMHDTHYIIKAHTPIEEFNEQLQATLDERSYDTIGGLLTATLGHLPKRGDIIVIEPFEFKIISADARRINLINCIDKRTS